MIFKYVLEEKHITLVLGLDLMFCGEASVEPALVKLKKPVLSFTTLLNFHPGLFLYFPDCKINN